jgi:integrase
VQADPTPQPGSLTSLTKGKFASITDPKGVGALMRSIRGYQGTQVGRLALQLAPLVFARPGELRAAQWSEFDLDAAEWMIPPERAKMRRPHLVPLSRQALDIFRELHKLTGSGRYVFPSERGAKRPMSENTLNAALRSLGYTTDQMVVHAFRHMASTLLHESRKWRSEVIERKLAHADRNSIRAVYNAAEYLTERREMMQAWADLLDTLSAAENVARFPVRA